MLNNSRAKEVVLEKISHQIRDFPGYAKIRRVVLLALPWTVENDMLTPTLKLRRGQMLERYKIEIDELYAGQPTR